MSVAPLWTGIPERSWQVPKEQGESRQRKSFCATVACMYSPGRYSTVQYTTRGLQPTTHSVQDILFATTHNRGAGCTGRLAPQPHHARAD